MSWIFGIGKGTECMKAAYSPP